MSAAARSLSPFGQQLRHWRRRSGLSQLDLSAQAGTTPRHLSFIETGRSRPGRELVLRLGEALDLSIRDRNTLLVSAGLSPAFAARELSNEAMRPINLVLEMVLRTHEPYPAWVVGRGLRFLKSNAAAEALFPGMCGLSAETIIDFWFGPGPYRELVENWHDVVRAGATSLRREAIRTSDRELFELAQRAETHVRALPESNSQILAEVPVVCPILRIGGQVVRTISTVMRFDSAVDVTVADLRVELLFPADDDSDAFFKAVSNA